MALLFAGMVIVIALQREGTKEAANLQNLRAFAFFSWLGLVGLIDALGGLLQQEADDAGGRFENRRAHERLQLLHTGARWSLSQEAGHQGRDFLLLG